MSESYWIKKIEDKPNFKLGQNFLVDTNISRKITKLVQGQLADPVIEIGPGTGSLTNELLKDNYRLRVIEKKMWTIAGALTIISFVVSPVGQRFMGSLTAPPQSSIIQPN